MKSTILILTLAVVTMIGSGFTPVTGISDYQGWARIGSKKVDYKIDRDIIKVGSSKGKFNKLKIQVSGGDLNMRKMTVEYGNGKKETINLRHKFQAGSGSRIVDLAGEKRAIKYITFWYDTRNNANKKAIVHVLGKH